MRRTPITTVCFCLLLFLVLPVYSQIAQEKQHMEQGLNNLFLTYKAKDAELPKPPRMTSFDVKPATRTVTVTVDDAFAMQEFTPSVVKKVYAKVRKQLSSPYNKYKIQVVTCGLPIEELIPDHASTDTNLSRAWGNIDYDGNPWVEKVSRPNRITHGLLGRHVALWASHGCYYDQKKMTWKWQRPHLFGTTEDLFTQTIVVPYLIPMLENAGAVVFTPRERDWQKREYIIDNDQTATNVGRYVEQNGRRPWVNAPERGFALHDGTYSDYDNPFTSGTARMTMTSKKERALSEISYQPRFEESGRYAVYVSYQTVEGGIDDAQYFVYHQGERTEYRVNQQMGGGTWVYLGTFDFDRGCNEYNRVVVTNHSGRQGLVTADAVRFGGGTGNMERDGETSGLPRALEGARYYAHWAGAPYQVYSPKGGTDDYSDDINVRSNMTNWLAGGSVYVPTLTGKGVPIELSLAVHSDAGYSADGQSLIGSLAICTTQFNDGRLSSGISRMASHDFAAELLNGVTRDLSSQYKMTWPRRYLWDRNYSETRLPEVPSAILETMSHQNFPDMKLGQDPNFRFSLARSIYKTVARYINAQHGRPCVIQPLPPVNFRVELLGHGKARLSWTYTDDPQENTAHPTSYNVYQATGHAGFDNGTNVKGTTCVVDLQPGTLYSFRVTAVNRGGESFPSEVLSALYNPTATQTVLVVNGFHRLSSPAVIQTDAAQGFDLDDDPGVSYGLTAGWNGRQQCFDRDKIGIEGPVGLGYGGDELAGQFVMGNTFDYVRTHAESIASTGKYNIASCCSHALEAGQLKASPYACVDLILGLERHDGHATQFYKSFTTRMQQILSAYAQGGGRIIASGAYIASDMTEDEAEKDFMNRVMRLQYGGTLRADTLSSVTGLGLNFNFYNQLNEHHYAVSKCDVLTPGENSFCAMQYDDGTSACVAYGGDDYRAITVGFPLECIIDPSARNAVMRGLLEFVMK